MKIYTKNPIVSSLFTIFITFLISMILFFIIKPSYIIDISKEGKKKINIYLLFIYSMLFAVLLGIVIFLCKTTTISTVKSNAYKPELSYTHS